MKKTLAIILALIMVVCLLPTVAFAEGNTITVGNTGADYDTLAAAVTAAKSGDTIVLTSNLTMTESARFWDKHLTITSGEGDPYTITRGAIVTANDTARGLYNPAMIEVQTSGSSASLTLTNIILDDAGNHAGTVFAQAISGEEPGDNTIYVQDAIVASNATEDCTITLGEGAILRNFGGMSAVRVTNKAKLVMKSGSVIEDNPVSKRTKGSAAGEVGPAGAVWIQSAAFEMEDGAKIQNVDGRAVYADGGEATIGGTISGITGNSNMWQGRSGTALHLRNNATGRLTATGRIENVTGGEKSTIVNLSGSTYTMDAGSVMSGNQGNNIVAYGGANTIYMNGEITGIPSGGNYDAINLQAASDAEDPIYCKIGATGNIHDNNVWYGSIYVQGNNIELHHYGKINNNSSSDKSGGIVLANNFTGAKVFMYDGAEVIGNKSNNDGAGVMVSCGTFTMNGGKISENIAKGQAGGVYVRRGGQFIMNGGEISNNHAKQYGGGVSFVASDYRGYVPYVALNGGTISGNMMGATIETNTATGMIEVSGGESNDLAVSNTDNVFSKADRYLYISDDVTIGNKAVYFEKDSKTVTPASDSLDIKFGNASAESVNALKGASNTKGWNDPLATFWTQRDNAATMTVGGIKITESNMPVYALVKATDANGMPDSNAEVKVYATKVEEGSVTFTIPGTGNNGCAVALVQPNQDFGNVVITGPAEIEKNPSATIYEIPYTATYTMSQNFKSMLLDQLNSNPDGVTSAINLCFVVELDNRLTAKKDAAGKFIYTFDGAGVLEPIESGIAVSGDGHTITVPCTLTNGWKDAINKEKIVMTLDGTGVLQAEDFTPGGVLGTTGNIQASLPIQQKIINVFIPANVCQTNMVGSDPTPSPSTDPSTSPTPTPGGGNGGGYYHPTTTPVPVIVIPPKTGDMTVWQSILNFLGIK